MRDDRATATTGPADAGDGAGGTPAKRVLHPWLDLLGRPSHASRSVLGRWDAKALLLLASAPGFDRDDFVWVGPECLGDDFCVSIYTGLSAESPYVWITEDGAPGRFLVRPYVGAADGQSPEDPFLVSGGTAEEVAAESLRMIASARSPGRSDRIVMVFKHEGEVAGEPIGPAVVVPVSETGERRSVGIPYVPKCDCARPVGSPGGRCGRCGDRIGEPWVTLTQARERARDLGVELREA
jgi:hypothetical protein